MGSNRNERLIERRIHRLTFEVAVLPGNRRWRDGHPRKRVRSEDRSSSKPAPPHTPRYCESIARMRLAAHTIHEKNIDSAKLWLVIRKKGNPRPGGGQGKR